MEHDDSNNSWGEDVEHALEKIRMSCLLRSKYHKTNYLKMNAMLKYFRIPIIILSALSSVFSVAFNTFIDQVTVSLVTCFLSLVAGLIGSIELFLQIQKRMEVDLLNAKDFYLKAAGITKTLCLHPHNRNGDGRSYLEDKFNEYAKLIESSVVFDKIIEANLVSLDFVNNLDALEKIGIVNDFESIQQMMRLRAVPKLESPLRSLQRVLGFPADATDAPIGTLQELTGPTVRQNNQSEKSDQHCFFLRSIDDELEEHSSSNGSHSHKSHLDEDDHPPVSSV